MTHELIHFDEARRALELAATVDEVKSIRDKAEAARVYARQIGATLEMQNQCCEIKLRAERQIGTILTEQPRQRPGEYKRSHDATVSPSLKDLGISKSQSSRWQAIAALPEARFEAFIDATKNGGRELTSAAALKLAKQERAQRAQAHVAELTPRQKGRVAGSLQELQFSGEQFGCILADPPWKYGNQGTRGSTDNHYATMSVEEIAALPIGELAAENCHLHLWTTNAFLFESKLVLDAWGFEYKSVFVWVKPELGLGNYWRVSHEFLLLGVRGSLPFQSRRERSWMEESRGRHSAKPGSVRQKIEAASPGPYLELFARDAVPGWTVWGNQVGSSSAKGRSS